MWSWLSRKRKSKGLWRLTLDQRAPELLESLDILHNHLDRFWKENYSEIGSLLVLSRYILDKQQRHSHLLPLMDRYCQILDSGCDDCDELAPGCEQCEFVLHCVRTCQKDLMASERAGPKRGWEPEDLRTPKDVASLLEALDELSDTSRLDCEHLDYLPLSIQQAILQPDKRGEFCTEAISNPALKGQLIDLYRGYSECMLSR